MLKNNNKAVINRLYRKMLKQNRLRNRVTIIAIILTSFMFTAIFTMGFSLAENLNEMLLRQQGSRSSVFLDNPSQKQIEEVGKLKSVEAAGCRIIAGSACDIDNNNSYMLYCYDDIEYEQNLKPAIANINGQYPVKEDEIMMPVSVLSALGIDRPQFKEEIQLIVNSQKTKFVLSGWYDGFSISNPVLISEKYAKKMGYALENSGQLCISAKNGDTDRLCNDLESCIQLEKNQEWDIKYDVQEEDKGNRIVTILMMCLISIMIVVSGYLLIYNVMYISVAKDTRFYGMLKTIGTSARQIRALVKKQTAHLAIIGITIGAALGTLASFVIVPLAMDMVGSNRTPGIISSEIDFNPLIYVFAIAFAAVTVYLGVRKPAKIAGKVSPVEALKYQSGKNDKIKSYKVSKKGKVFSMAYRNVFRDKKRCRLVFASLFFGTVIFLCVNTFIRCLDADTYLDNYFYNDYVLYPNDDLFQQEEPEKKQGSMKTMEELAEEIKSIPGIGQVRTNKYSVAVLDFDAELFRPFLESEMNQSEMTLQEMTKAYENAKEVKQMYSTNVISVDSKMIELYNEKARQKIDIESFKKGQVCLIGYPDTVENSEKLQDKTIRLENPDTKVQKTIKIGAAPTYQESYGLTCGYYGSSVGAPSMILVSDTFMSDLFPNAGTNCIIADAKWGQESKVTPEIQRIIKENIVIGGTDIRSIEGKEFKKSLMSLTVIGDAISIILILIGLINFINVMLTGVYTRNNELAILESVGMTKRQICKMLVLEGGVYGIITIVLVLTLGTGMMYATGELCKRMADYASMHYPFGLVIVISIIILLICTIVPVMVFKEISKRTVSERLRLGEV